MKEKSFVVLNVVLTFCGVLFSGYMSAIKFFSSNCVFNEPCPLFLGHPACYYGFGMFCTLFLTSVLAWAHLLRVETTRPAIRTVSFAGVLFAGNFVVQEFQRYSAGGYQPGTLVLPTCAYGLIFFLTIFGVSFGLAGPRTHPNVPIEGSV